MYFVFDGNFFIVVQSNQTSTFQYNLEIVIFYTEILTGKVVLWCFFSSKTTQFFKSKSQYRTQFFQMRWKRNQNITPTYFSIEFGKSPTYVLFIS